MTEWPASGLYEGSTSTEQFGPFMLPTGGSNIPLRVSVIMAQIPNKY